ncbi:MAG: InlB B-repeat-containing protein [Lachnospiraceae bacterium]|nr:InlB B-repeat-containing protein [Lachnospiraceae bacterium]
MKGRIKKGIAFALSTVLLVTFLVLTNFVGICPQKVFASSPVQVISNGVDLITAINNASTDSDNPTRIELGDDFDCSTDEIVVNPLGYVVLNLGGKTLTVNNCIDVYGNLTVEGSGTLTGVSNSGGTISVHNGGVFTLVGGNIESLSLITEAVSVGHGGSFSMSDGTISSSGRIALYIVGNATISGGTIICDEQFGAAARVLQIGTLTISGGTLQGTYRSLDILGGGQATQTGGTLIGGIDVDGNSTFNFQGGTNPAYSAISFAANGGSGTMNPQGVRNGVATSLTANSFTRDGYSFDGWKDSAGNDYADGATVNINANMTLTAQWKLNSSPASTTTSGTSTAPSSAPSTSVEEDDSNDNSRDELSKKLATAIALGGEQTIEMNDRNTLSYDVMKTLQDNPNLTLVLSYSYEGKDYNVTLPGYMVKADDSIPWYGPLYLYGNYGMISANAITATPSNRTYTVVSGDTLNRVAAKLGTSVPSLVSLNKIKNPDFIREGPVLNY